jgi:hypothetical protein
MKEALSNHNTGEDEVHSMAFSPTIACHLANKLCIITSHLLMHVSIVATLNRRRTPCFFARMLKMCGEN